MKFLIRTTDLYEVGDYVDKYPTLKRFKFKTEITKDHFDHEVELGFIELNTIDELVKLMNTLDQSLIFFPFDPNSDEPAYNTPMIEIYDAHRE